MYKHSNPETSLEYVWVHSLRSTKDNHFHDIIVVYKNLEDITAFTEPGDIEWNHIGPGPEPAYHYYRTRPNVLGAMSGVKETIARRPIWGAGVYHDE